MKILQDLRNKYDLNTIENSVIKLFLNKNNIIDVKNIFIKEKIENYNDEVYSIIDKNFNLNTFDALNIFFENLFDDEEKAKNGIVFTPEYIADYIVKNTVLNYNSNCKIIDPSCGCGIFLISTIKYLHNKYSVKIIDIIENNLYGLDIKSENIERVKILLSLFSIINNEDCIKVKFNLVCSDSLFTNWDNIFNIDKFDYIIGNPPYVNNHELDNDYIEKLKITFKTTKKGTFNIFYAFIEKSDAYINKNGTIGYIIPNNFLHIKSASELRAYIKENNLLYKIIDFKDNTVFSPVLTYNCIIFLNKNNKYFNYAQIDKSSNINLILKNLKFQKKSIDDLKEDGWILTNNIVTNNIKNIESFPSKLGPYIKTGIATLRDNIYIIDNYDEDNKMYYKIHNSKKYYIEESSVRDFIKISKYKSAKKIEKIIFPYKILNGKTIPYDENELKIKFPLTYYYLKKVKNILSERDKGKEIIPWYIYGRSQGISNFNEKILFSTFNSIPNFFISPNDNALFSNGYCISGYNDNINLLLKIINSSVMKYYISHTSYSISGGYKCFQKKYIKNFSIPTLSEDEKNKILNLNDNDLDDFLFKLYDLR